MVLVSKNCSFIGPFTRTAVTAWGAALPTPVLFIHLMHAHLHVHGLRTVRPCVLPFTRRRVPVLLLVRFFWCLCCSCASACAHAAGACHCVLMPPVYRSCATHSCASLRACVAQPVLCAPVPRVCRFVLVWLFSRTCKPTGAVASFQDATVHH